MDPARRQLLLGLVAAPLAGGCATPLPLGDGAAARPDDVEAFRRLADSAAHHGLESFRRCTDIAVAYDGRWRALIGRIQPEIVDAAYRRRSEERLLPAAGVLAQAHRGPGGHKQVWRRRGPPGDPGAVRVWYDGHASADTGVEDAAALVADCYALFLLGPLWLAPQAEAGAARVVDGEPVRVDGHRCRWIHAWVRPGLGRVALDRVSLAIDERDRTTRRMRFTLEGYAGTRGAVAETDTYDHARREGVLWPMRSYERVLHPIRNLPAHDWWITGLDVNRGYGPDDVAGPEFTGRAAVPATPV